MIGTFRFVLLLTYTSLMERCVRQHGRWRADALKPDAAGPSACLRRWPDARSHDAQEGRGEMWIFSTEARDESACHSAVVHSTHRQVWSHTHQLRSNKLGPHSRNFLGISWEDFSSYCYYYYTRFKHVKSFTKVKNIKCERWQCHRRNARLYRAVLSLVLKVAMLTVISEVTVSESLFQTAGVAMDNLWPNIWGKHKPVIISLYNIVQHDAEIKGLITIVIVFPIRD